MFRIVISITLIVLVLFIQTACQPAIEPIGTWDDVEIAQVQFLADCRESNRNFACDWVLVGDENSANIGVDEECIRFDIKWSNGVRLSPENPFLPTIDVEASPGNDVYFIFLKEGSPIHALIVHVKEGSAVG